MKVGLPTCNPTHSTAPESCQRLTKDFYKANTALPTKTPTDFDKNVTAAYYFTRTITVMNLLTPTITSKHNGDFGLYVTIDHFYKANATLPTKTPTDFIKYVTTAYYFTRTITVTNSLTPTITNKTNRMTTLDYT